MIFSMILAVMLCVVFSMPSLAFEADEPAPEAEPEEVNMTEPAPEPTVTISAPVEIAVIPDDDWGSVQPDYASMVMAATTEKAMNSEAVEPEETPAPTDTPVTEPEDAPETPASVDTPVAEPEDAPETPASVDTPVAEPEDVPETPAPVETEPATVAEEEAPADLPVEETPETDQPAADIPEEDTTGEAPDEPVTESKPDAGETAQEAPEEEILDGEDQEEAPEEPEEGPENPEEASEDPETAPEPETARVTVTVEISMIDETVMRLLAVVNDPEGRDFLYQWQVSEDCGMTYTDIPEANTDELKVELTDENITDMWRVKVQAV